MQLNARIVREGDGYWATVDGLPGCFASGDTLDELVEALEEAVSMCLDGHPADISLGGLTLAVV